MPSPSVAKSLFEQGKVREAQGEIASYLRDHPSDVAQRTFLFELLCFSGDFDRAEKQLAILAQSNAQTELGAVLYYSALHAERTRHELFEKQNFPAGHTSESLAGVLNGKPFQSFRDADPDIGARLEVFAAGAYLWIPLEHIASVEVQAPRRLRDTLWTPALVRTGPTFKGTELGEVLIPAVYPFSWKDQDESVWLGRVTSWAADEKGTEYPSGQKMFVVDGEEVPFLELRTLEFAAQETPSRTAAAV
jgi:type VI secretion system protein ImpE